MNKYYNKSNVIEKLLKEHREKLGLTKVEVCKLIQLHGVDINRVVLYKMEMGQSIIKNFELIALCEVLKIDYNIEIKNLID